MVDVYRGLRNYEFMNIMISQYSYGSNILNNVCNWEFGTKVSGHYREGGCSSGMAIKRGSTV